ncbi:MAG: VTC domain-containing protein [Planctomycetota bacterium]
MKSSSQTKAGTHHHRSGAGSEKGADRGLDGMLRCRYELKYHINESKAEAVERFIRPYLHLDHYCKLRPSGTYPIATLYLDSADLRLCRQTLEGNKNRFKLRIRSYTDDVSYPRFFEIKRRMNAIIIKSRARVMHRDVTTLLSGLSLPHQQFRADEETVRQFQLYMKCINAGAVMRVRYLRRAYEGDTENRVRVTFDRELAYNAGREINTSLEGPRWQRHGLNGVILEIKFTSRYPAWLSHMVKYLSLRQESISKYVTSVKQSSLAGFCAPRLGVR